VWVLSLVPYGRANAAAGFMGRFWRRIDCTSIELALQKLVGRTVGINIQFTLYIIYVIYREQSCLVFCMNSKNNPEEVVPFMGLNGFFV
jgi:hypothetical protein